ncbi:hypothetical protein [Streptomyces hoynatensis]|uniref:Mom family adenine methylcarbamoylation protein n=1 Tax=Streptomyces hoynatensis TaxID=1141874 RepID=UPI0011C34FD8|nr:hypothetical protein [Streptomyces hoynatensis]
MRVEPLGHAEARAVAEAEHYMHRKPTVSHAFGLLEGDKALGVVTFGTPASRHLQMGVCPSDPSLVVELNRLWVHDSMPTNTESWFVSRALRQLPPRIVVSYADTTQGHMGYVYRALNFRYAGWTDMERKTPRYDYMPDDPSIHTRDAYRHGYVRKVRRKPKVRYWIPTGNRRERRQMEALCGWPSLSWKELPPPTEHRHHPL